MLSLGIALVGFTAFKTATNYNNTTADSPATMVAATVNIEDIDSANSSKNTDSKNADSKETAFGRNLRFYTAVLKRLGANITPEKIKFLEAWRRGEGGSAKNNPFNTTKDVPGEADTKYNSVGVRNYPDHQTGLEATVATLKLSYYREIVDLLRRDNVTAKQIARCKSLKKWGTGDNVKKVLAKDNIKVPAADVALTLSDQWCVGAGLKA